MESTGERYSPEMRDPQISYEHWHRYLYASQFVKGRVVLDVACGEGYGSNLLAEEAERVVGVDISQEAIGHAVIKYVRENLTFRVGSAAAIPLMEGGGFDVIVSFETLEHLTEANQVAFLGEVRRLLRREGIFICSTPNRLLYSDIRGFRNEFHIKEYYEEEFRSLLQGYFTRVEVLGQSVYRGSYIWTPRAQEGRGVEYTLERSEEGFCPSPDGMQMLYLIAICSDRDLKDVNSSILFDVTEPAVSIEDQPVTSTAWWHAVARCLKRGDVAGLLGVAGRKLSRRRTGDVP